MATGTTIAACHAYRAGATETARAAGTAEQSARTAIATEAARDERGTTVTAGTEPSRRPTVTTGEAVPAVADQAAVAAVARTAEAGTFVLGVAVAVTEQNPCVGIVGGARPDENTDEVGYWIGGDCRAR